MKSEIKNKTEIMYKDEKQRSVELQLGPLGPKKGIAQRTPVHELLEDLDNEGAPTDQAS